MNSRRAIAFFTITASTLISQISLAETKIGTSGNVKAEISYQEKPQYEYQVHLKIFRGGKKLLDIHEPQKDVSDKPVVGIDPDNKLPVLDLDGNKEPEVIADFFTGGAHCCTYSLIYRYQSKEKRYTVKRFDWGNVGYELKDLNNDKLPEFRSADDRFAYAFASYAASGFPLQIWQYRQGKMIDVTRKYPKLIRANALELWQSYQQAKKEDGEVKGLLTAYLADKYLLGESVDGWKRVKQVYKASDRDQYFAAVRKFLGETGYLKVRS
ncbi:hypothetical protein [Merismopedia glauca]|uniref:WD-40 repeat-containing protein n=1 Tax=Merismopedia glauca CCAP 1448/3 TaxID=1296344 RepID=A0A2T1C1A3_9CYAN|nr:hypothetical protein [Merismopedia glauca]PSB02049.1 hypothetical protein C7B64_15235 [Merismopedia glauca CCAP 1448/3]